MNISSSGDEADAVLINEHNVLSGPAIPDAQQETLDSHLRRTIDAYPIQPDVVQIVNMPKSHVNHTYRNFSNIPLDPSYSMPTQIQVMTFHEKLYHLLTFSNPIYREAIRWSSHGRSFEVVDAARFSRLGILRSYFGYTMIPQFRKQLHNAGYKQITTGTGGCEVYYSEFLLRGIPHVLRLSPEVFDCRTLLPDPAHEPDFEDIARLYPLPHERSKLLHEARRRLSARGILIYDDVFESVSKNWKPDGKNSDQGATSRLAGHGHVEV